MSRPKCPALITIDIDSDFKITKCSPNVERVLGYVPRELLGCDINMLLPLNMRSSHHDKIQSFMDSDETMYQCRVMSGQTKNGSVIKMFISVEKRSFADKRVYRAYVNGFDNTDIKLEKIASRLEKLSAP
jgi:PAS domain S-box-containing protein